MPNSFPDLGQSLTWSIAILRASAPIWGTSDRNQAMTKFHARNYKQALFFEPGPARNSQAPDPRYQGRGNGAVEDSQFYVYVRIDPITPIVYTVKSMEKGKPD